MSYRMGLGQWSIVIVFVSLALVSFMGAMLALYVYKATPFGTVLLAIATSFLSTIVVFMCDRAVPRAEANVQVKHGHEAIYKEYIERLGNLAQGEPHVIRTVASLPPSSDVAKNWDNFLVPFLEKRSDITYKRVIVVNETEPEWERRKKELKDRYLTKKLANYKQFETEGPPSIECLLVDDAFAFVTFASAGRHFESSGLLLKDKKICRELEHYFENQLLPLCKNVN